MTDPIVVAARFIAANLEWLRHRPNAAEALAAIEECARVVRGIARGPAEQKYLGPCGALMIAPMPPQDGCDCGHEGLDSWFHLKPCPVAYLDQRSVCEGDVYAPRGGSVGRCRACGAEVASADRQAWLDGEVRNHAFRASEISDAYGVNENTIRSWATRGQLRSYWRTDAGIVTEWTEPPEGEKRKRLHYVGDVLDLAAADAARRATEQAKRARRAAARAADDERMSA